MHFCQDKKENAITVEWLGPKLSSPMPIHSWHPGAYLSYHMNGAIKIISLGKTYLHLVPTTLIYEKCRRAILGSESTYAWVCMFRDPLDYSLAGSSMGFCRQEYWRGLLFLPPGIFPTQGSNPSLLWLLLWQVDSWPLNPLGSPMFRQVVNLKNNFTQTMIPPGRDPKLKVGNRERTHVASGVWQT